MKVFRDQLHAYLIIAAVQCELPQPHAAIKCAQQTDCKVNSGAEYLHYAVKMKSAALLEHILAKEPDQAAFALGTVLVKQEGLFV